MTGCITYNQKRASQAVRMSEQADSMETVLTLCYSGHGLCIILVLDIQPILIL